MFAGLAPPRNQPLHDRRKRAQICGRGSRTRYTPKCRRLWKQERTPQDKSPRADRRPWPMADDFNFEAVESLARTLVDGCGTGRNPKNFVGNGAQEGHGWPEVNRTLRYRSAGAPPAQRRSTPAQLPPGSSLRPRRDERGAAGPGGEALRAVDRPDHALARQGGRSAGRPAAGARRGLLGLGRRPLDLLDRGVDRAHSPGEVARRCGLDRLAAAAEQLTVASNPKSTDPV